MSARARLLHIGVQPDGKVFVLRIEPDAGEPVEVLATLDQLDALADALDDVLLDAAEEAGNGG